MYDDDDYEKLLEYYKTKEDIYWDGVKRPFGWVAMEFGDDMAERVLKSQREKQKGSPPKNNASKALNDFTPKENKHKQQPIDGQFLALTDKQFFNNEDLMIKIANKTGLLLVLLRNKVDWDKNEKLNLYQEFYVKRKLIAASISRPELARIFGKEKRRITEWAKALEKDGIIKIEQIPCTDDDDNCYFPE